MDADRRVRSFRRTSIGTDSFSASGVSPIAINIKKSPTSSAAFRRRWLGQWTPAQIKTYLRWHTITTYAPMLPQAFADENFAFYSTALNGATQAQLPQGRRCTSFYRRRARLRARTQKYVAKSLPAGS